MALALYRKYRPRTFAEVIGQEHVTEPLSQALRSGRLHHAYLFSGPRGCGKTSSARILARSLNCERGPTPEPCGVCESCRALAPDGSGSIDVIEIDAASHGGVDDARELRERAFFAPAASRFKIYVIDEAHMVSTQGFNALLKLVEEPPDYVKFIFATTEPDKVLGTIKSRTHHYPFRLIPPGILRPYLEQLAEAEKAKVEPAVFPLVVRAGGGSARDSLSVLDQLIAGAGPDGVSYSRAVSLLGVTDAALIDEMCDALAAGDGAAAYSTIDRVAEAGHDPRRFASDLLERLRDLIVFQQVPDAAAKGLIDGPTDQLERMAAQAQRLGPATLSRSADIVHNGLIEMRGTTAPRLLLELITARMLLPTADTSQSALLQRLERMERRIILGDDADFGEPDSSVDDDYSGPAVLAGRGGGADRRPGGEGPPGTADGRRPPAAPDRSAPSGAAVAGERPPAAAEWPDRSGAAVGDGSRPAAGGGAAAARAAAAAAASRSGVTRRSETAKAPSAAGGIASEDGGPIDDPVPASETNGSGPAMGRDGDPAGTARATVDAAAGTPGVPSGPGADVAEFAGDRADDLDAATVNDGGQPRTVPPQAVMADPATPDPVIPDGGTAGTLDAVGVRRVWDEIVGMVRVNNKKIAALASEATVRDVDGDTLVLTFRHSFHARTLAENPEPLSDAVYEVLGGRWQIRCELAGDQRGGAGPDPARPGGGREPGGSAPAGSRRDDNAPTSGARPSGQERGPRERSSSDRSTSGASGDRSDEDHPAARADRDAAPPAGPDAGYRHDAGTGRPADPGSASAEHGRQAADAYRAATRTGPVADQRLSVENAEVRAAPGHAESDRAQAVGAGRQPVSGGEPGWQGTEAIEPQALGSDRGAAGLASSRSPGGVDPRFADSDGVHAGGPGKQTPDDFEPRPVGSDRGAAGLASSRPPAGVDPRFADSDGVHAGGPGKQTPDDFEPRPVGSDSAGVGPAPSRPAGGADARFAGSDSAARAGGPGQGHEDFEPRALGSDRSVDGGVLGRRGQEDSEPRVGLGRGDGGRPAAADPYLTGADDSGYPGEQGRRLPADVERRPDRAGASGGPGRPAVGPDPGTGPDRPDSAAERVAGRRGDGADQRGSGRPAAPPTAIDAEDDWPETALPGGVLAEEPADGNTSPADSDWPETAVLPASPAETSPIRDTGGAGGQPHPASPVSAANTSAAVAYAAAASRAPLASTTAPGRPAAPVSGGAAAAARAAARAAAERAKAPAGTATATAAGTRQADSDWAGEPPFDPDYDGGARGGGRAVRYEGFDPGDEPTDEVIDEKTARQSSEQQAFALLQAALGVERIGEIDLK